MTFVSKNKNAQKRRREREKAETANKENRTDSGFSSTEERESYNELDAPRDLTAGENLGSRENIYRVIIILFH